MSIQKKPGLINYICAPMDGVTDYIFRQCQARHFTPADEYFTPFLSLTCGHGFQKREHSEMDPDNNRGLNVIPQIIGNDPEDFLWGIRELADLGYKEVNINMGCPSKVVVRKHKGAGMLGDHELIRRTLDRIFDSDSASRVKISVKTRIGLHDFNEFPAIMEIFNAYPLSRLIVHPRVSDQLYSGTVDMTAWEYALEHSACPLCYNGDIFSPEDLMEQHMGCEQIMLGRGLVRNPALVGELKGEETFCLEKFIAFHDDIMNEQSHRLMNDSHTLKRMKELWYYWGQMFPDQIETVKQLRRTQTLSEYDHKIRELGL